MLHKGLSIILVDIFTNFRGIVSGPVIFSGSVCFGKVLISATQGKSKVTEETKLFLIFSIIGCLS